MRGFALHARAVAFVLDVIKLLSYSSMPHLLL
jgi:hypothetical protein